jgi:hypothetical protein
MKYSDTRLKNARVLYGKKTDMLICLFDKITEIIERKEGFLSGLFAHHQLRVGFIKRNTWLSFVTDIKETCAYDSREHESAYCLEIVLPKNACKITANAQQSQLRLCYNLDTLVRLIGKSKFNEILNAIREVLENEIPDCPLHEKDDKIYSSCIAWDI